ncbi:MAG: acyltransferase [Bacteroides sp.]|nr:acyltransferase [Bacteroides sp.]
MNKIITTPHLKSNDSIHSQSSTKTSNRADSSRKHRVDYVDLLKGITILWIIWIHTDHPEFGGYRNPIFFFASGIFFKILDAKTFFSKRVWMIIIPFIFFYLLSVLCRYLLDIWDTRTLDSFDWHRILDFTVITARQDYLSLNVPLWFLLTLFWIQTFSFIVFRFSKYIIGILAFLSIVFFEEIYSIPTPLMINNAVAWFGYFAFGYLMGKPLIKYLNSTSRKVKIFILTAVTVILCIGIESLEVELLERVITPFKYIVFIICFMTFFSFFDGKKYMDILRFYGKNSLIILGAHLWILIPVGRISFRLTGVHDPWIGLVSAIITAICLIPVIQFLSKYCAVFVGKRNS